LWGEINIRTVIKTSKKNLLKTTKTFYTITQIIETIKKVSQQPIRYRQKSLWLRFKIFRFEKTKKVILILSLPKKGEKKCKSYPQANKVF